MATSNIEQLVCCGICFEGFDETDRRPRILSCGHSFCNSCLKKILEQRSCSYCPICKMAIRVKNSESIPINFNLESLVLKINKKSQKTKNILEGKSQECWPNEMDISNFQNLKQQFVQKLEKTLNGGKVKNQRILESIKFLEEERKKLLEEIKEKETELNKREKLIEELESLKCKEQAFCDRLAQLQTLIEISSSNDADFSNAIAELNSLLNQGNKQISELALRSTKFQVTLESLTELCSKETVYVAEESAVGVLYGQVMVRDTGVWIYSFEHHKPDARVIAFKDVLAGITGASSPSKILLKRAFLQLTAAKGDESCDVLIEIDKPSPRTKNFTLLCSGLKGSKYKGLTLRYDSPACYELYPGPPPAVKGISKRDPETPRIEGLINGMNKKDSWFDISLKNDPALRHHRIGVVVSGLDDLKELNKQGKNLLIKNCGLVI